MYDELMKMEGTIVWSIVDKKTVPKSKNVLNMKWVYIKKLWKIQGEISSYGVQTERRN